MAKTRLDLLTRYGWEYLFLICIIESCLPVRYITSHPRIHPPIHPLVWGLFDLTIHWLLDLPIDFLIYLLIWLLGFSSYLFWPAPLLTIDCTHPLLPFPIPRGSPYIPRKAKRAFGRANWFLTCQILLGQRNSDHVSFFFFFFFFFLK